MDYAIRMPANKTLELAVEDILFRPPGRPSCKPLVRYRSFRYQAKSWTTARLIVAKVEHHRGELFPRVGFIVTNMVLPSRSVGLFESLAEVRKLTEDWLVVYNQERPHDSLGRVPPLTFLPRLNPPVQSPFAVST